MGSTPLLFFENVKKKASKKLPQNVWIRVHPPPPFWTMSKSKRFFSRYVFPKPKCVAKRQFQPIWATFWPPWGHNWDILGLANVPNWSAWMSSIPFQPGSSIVLLNRWSHLALIVQMPVWPFLGPWRAQICEMPCAQVRTEVSAHCGTRKNH